VGDVLRRERQDLFQRELLLDTVIQSTPLALVLTSAAGHVIYSNTVARQMFGKGSKLEGLVFDTLVDETPASLQEAVRGGQDTLFSLEGADGGGGAAPVAAAFRAERSRSPPLPVQAPDARADPAGSRDLEEGDRVISHELNNSPAPISSLAFGGASPATGPGRLDSIFATIEGARRT
jgi:PAS domain-containing protein